MDSERLTADPRVAAVLAAAAAPAESPLLGEAAVLAAFRREYDVRRRSRLPFAMTAKVAIAGGLGAALMVGGVAAAATGGTLTAPLLGLVGQHHSSPAAQPTSPTGEDTAPVGLTGEVPSDAPGHASRMATLATSTTTTGATKGSTICTAASHTKCKAGQHGQGSTAGAHRSTGSASTHAGDHPTDGATHRPTSTTDHSTTGRSTAITHIGLRPVSVPAAAAH
jgi:hypothetical protein